MQVTQPIPTGEPPAGCVYVDHPRNPRTLADWLQIQRDEYADYETGLVIAPHSGDVLLWRREA